LDGPGKREPMPMLGAVMGRSKGEYAPGPGVLCAVNSAARSRRGVSVNPWCRCT